MPMFRRRRDPQPLPVVEPLTVRWERSGLNKEILRDSADWQRVVGTVPESEERYTLCRATVVDHENRRFRLPGFAYVTDQAFYGEACGRDSILVTRAAFEAIWWIGPPIDGPYKGQGNVVVVGFELADGSKEHFALQLDTRDPRWAGVLGTAFDLVKKKTRFPLA